VIWVAVGGRGTLVGAALGAVVVNYAKTWFTTGALAALLAVRSAGSSSSVTLFLPKGIVGTLGVWSSGPDRVEARRGPSAARGGRLRPTGGVAG
jgi:urea transport system permease protein